MKWYVSVATQTDGQDYVGIDEYYGGEEQEPGFVSLHDTHKVAEAAAKEHAQKSGLPLFEDFRWEGTPCYLKSTTSLI